MTDDLTRLEMENNKESNIISSDVTSLFDYTLPNSRTSSKNVTLLLDHILPVFNTILPNETLPSTTPTFAFTSTPPSLRYNLRKRKRNDNNNMEGQRNSKIIRVLLISLNKPASESIEHAMIAISNIHQFEKEMNNEIALKILTLLADTPAEADIALPAIEILGIKISNTYKEAMANKKHAKD